MSSLVESFSRLFVPGEILEHFTVVDLSEQSGVIIISLVEKDTISHLPAEARKGGRVVKDGYLNEVEIQTFPAQGKEVFLRLKRRRWKAAGSTKGYHNQYDFYDPGMKATKEFGAFLKEIGRG